MLSLTLVYEGTLPSGPHSRPRGRTHYNSYIGLRRIICCVAKFVFHNRLGDLALNKVKARRKTNTGATICISLAGRDNRWIYSVMHVRQKKKAHVCSSENAAKCVLLVGIPQLVAISRYPSVGFHRNKLYGILFIFPCCKTSRLYNYHVFTWFSTSHRLHSHKTFLSLWTRRESQIPHEKKKRRAGELLVTITRIDWPAVMLTLNSVEIELPRYLPLSTAEFLTVLQWAIFTHRSQSTCFIVLTAEVFRPS